MTDCFCLFLRCERAFQSTLRLAQHDLHAYDHCKVLSQRCARKDAKLARTFIFRVLGQGQMACPRCAWVAAVSLLWQPAHPSPPSLCSGTQCTPQLSVRRRRCSKTPGECAQGPGVASDCHITASHLRIDAAPFTTSASVLAHDHCDQRHSLRNPDRAARWHDLACERGGALQIQVQKAGGDYLVRVLRSQQQHCICRQCCPGRACSRRPLAAEW